jgi:hypothetical protein
VDLLAKLIQQAGKRIIVMPGGGITERNIGKLRALTNATEMHVSGRGTVESKMVYRNKNVFMGGALRLHCFFFFMFFVFFPLEMHLISMAFSQTTRVLSVDCR